MAETQSIASSTPSPPLRTIALRVTDLTADSFGPYGQVLDLHPDGLPFGPHDAQLDLSRGIPRFYLMRLQTTGLQFDRITHHAKTTQCLGALNGLPWYLGVTRSTIIGATERVDTDKCEEVLKGDGYEYLPPAVEDIRIFRVDGPRFLKLHVGTWHAGPLFDEPWMDFYNLELSNTNAVDRPTYNFKKNKGIVFKVVDRVSYWTNTTNCVPKGGPGVNYALNWALCAKGVAPKGEAYRNLRESELKKLNATIPAATKTTSICARGSYSSGATDISKAQFNRLYKEVTASLTSSQKLYVHDGAIDSSPRCDAKVRTISDNPSSALLFRSILEPAPTRQVSQQVFPFSVYIASSYSPSDVGSVELTNEDKGAFVVIDYDRSAMILGGSAFTDVETVKKALAALTAPSILFRDALLLSARWRVNKLQVARDVLRQAPFPEHHFDIKLMCFKTKFSWGLPSVARFMSSEKLNKHEL